MAGIVEGLTSLAATVEELRRVIEKSLREVAQ